ncbi:MAG: phosphatase PAP2 family protein [Ktedonobacterales bacterium]
MALHTDEQRTEQGHEQPDGQEHGDAQNKGGLQQQVEHVQQQAQGQVEQAAQRVERERYQRGRITKRGTALLIGYVIALAAVVGLSLAAHAFSVLPGDLGFSLELQESRYPAIFDLMYGISLFGYLPWSVIVEVAALAILWLLRLRIEAIFLALTLLADGLGGLIKLLVDRHRPSASLVHVSTTLSSPGFPSGHTVHYTVFFGFILYILLVNFRPSWRRNLLVTICALLIALIGVSRVYLGEHWLSDVVGGYLVGALCLIPIIYGYLWARRRYGERMDRLRLFPLRHRRQQGRAA